MSDQEAGVLTVPSSEMQAVQCAPDLFRAALRKVPAAVAIVAAEHDGRRGGLTATAICSVSAEPPQILVCIHRAARTWNLISGAAQFSVNFLAASQQDLARRFSQPEMADGERFAKVAWRTFESGTPLLPEALVSFDCSVVTASAHGTHDVFIGAVRAIIADSSEPLLYRDGQYRVLNSLGPVAVGSLQ